MKNIFLNDLQIHDNSQNIGYWVMPPIDGLESPSIRLSDIERANVDGSFVSSHLYGGRMVTFQGKVMGSNLTEYRQRRRALESVARIYRPNGTMTSILMRFKTMDNLLLQMPVFVRKFSMSDRYMLHTTYKLDLLCPNIRILSQVEKSQGVYIFSGGGFAIESGIPLDISQGGSTEVVINNAGNISSQPTFRIHGSIEDPVILNQTTGKSFTIDYALTTANEFIDVDIKNRTVLYYANQTTAPVNIRDKFSGDWWEIEPGNNLLKLVVVDTTDTGYFIVRWRDAYSGI